MSSAATPTTYPEGPRHATVTSDDHGAIIQIVTWFLMVVMVLATALRLCVRFTTTHIPGVDDLMLSVATLFGVGEVIAISLAIVNGVGKSALLIDQTQMLSVEKAVYVSTILYLLTIALTKASVLLLLARLVTLKLQQHIVRTLGGIIVLWIVASVFAVAFQCPLPLPWDYQGGKCFDSLPFWYSIATVDILTDFVLIALPASVVWDLHMAWQRKVVVSSAFAFRFILIGTQVARLVYLRQLCHTALAVVVASIPALKPFMDRATSGMMTVTLSQREGTYGWSDSYAMHSFPKEGSRTKNSGKSGQGHHWKHILRPDQSGHAAVVSSTKRESNRGMDQIHKTVDVVIRYSDEARLNLPWESEDEPIDNSSSDTARTVRR